MLRPFLPAIMRRLDNIDYAKLRQVVEKDWQYLRSIRLKRLKSKGSEQTNRRLYHTLIQARTIQFGVETPRGPQNFGGYGGSQVNPAKPEKDAYVRDQSRGQMKETRASEDRARGVDMNEMAKDTRQVAEAGKQKTGEAKEELKEKYHEAKEDVKQAYNQSGTRSAMETAKEKAHDAKEMVQEKAHDAKEMVQEKAHDAKEMVQEKAHDAKEMVQEKMHKAKEWVKDNITGR